MQISMQIKNSLFEEIRKHPFFFIKLHEESKYDYKNQKEETYLYCKAIDHEDAICFSADKFGNPSFGYCLCKVDRGEFVSVKEGQMNKNMVTMYFHEVVPLEEELSAILHDCVSRSVNLEDKYSFVTLLWVLVELPTS